MSACRYRLLHVSVEPDPKGTPMRRLIFGALPCEPFGDDTAGAHASGTISHLVTPAYAEKFKIGDDYSVTFRERDS